MSAAIIRRVAQAIGIYPGEKHGHLSPLPRGNKMRCAGPQFCEVCKAEEDWWLKRLDEVLGKKE